MASIQGDSAGKRTVDNVLGLVPIGALHLEMLVLAKTTKSWWYLDYMITKQNCQCSMFRKLADKWQRTIQF